MSDHKKPVKLKSKRPNGSQGPAKIAKKKKAGTSEPAVVKPKSITQQSQPYDEKEEDEEKDEEEKASTTPAIPTPVTKKKVLSKKGTEKKAAAQKKEESTSAASASTTATEGDKQVQIIGNSSIGIADDSGADVTFESLGLCPQLVEACKAVGWKKPTEIQRETLPHAFAGKDLIGLAETGSGKTGAFGLPMLQALLKNPQPLFGLILAPTRELAFQITQQLEALGAGIGVRCVSIVGGVDMMDQAIALAKRPHIIVASPGRIVDHLENTKGFHLRNLKFLVMDEADRLLNMDFEKALDKLLAAISRDRTTYLFSATMTSKVGKLQRASLSDPVKVEVSRKYQTVKGLVQQYIFVPAKYKDCYLAYILNELAGNTAIIFAGKREQAQRLALMLRNLGFSAIPLHGKMSQAQRLGSLNKFKTGERGILIATDVASRGLDIPAVDLVVNYDIPSHSKDYVHRVGRTARAGRSGRAISIVTQYEVELFQRIEGLIEKKMELYTTENDAVMVLLERVSEAQRIAALEMREADEAGKGVHAKGKFGKGKRGGKKAGGGGGNDEEAD